MKAVRVTLEFRADDLLEMALIKDALESGAIFNGDDDLRDAVHVLLAQCVDPEDDSDDKTMLQIAFESQITEKSAYVGPHGEFQ